MGTAMGLRKAKKPIKSELAAAEPTRLLRDNSLMWLRHDLMVTVSSGRLVPKENIIKPTMNGDKFRSFKMIRAKRIITLDINKVKTMPQNAKKMFSKIESL